MPVVKATIEAAFNALDAQAQSSEMTKEAYNAERAQIIVDAILSATVDPGAVVATPDTLVGTVTGPGTLS